MGVHLNADHMPMCETGGSCNYVHVLNKPLVTYGKSRQQAESIIGDAVDNVVGYAREAGKPLLDFGQRKAEMEGQSAGTAG